MQKTMFWLRCVSYPFLALLSLTFTLFSVLCVYPWLPLFANKQGKVPRIFSWFVTFDASLDEGWRGGYIDPHWGKNGLMRYLARVYWLYRNPGYGFDHDVLGIRFDPQAWRVVRHIDTPKRVLFIAVGPAFNLYAQGRFGLLKLGWKASNFWDKDHWKTDYWARVPLCCSWSPFKRRTR